MKYVCLIYVEGRKLGSLSPRRRRALAAAAAAYEAGLRESGHYLYSTGLVAGESGPRVAVRDSGVCIGSERRGPAAEGLAGCIMIEAAGLHEALHLAAAMPIASLGSIEVRPVRNARAPGNPMSTQRMMEVP